VEFEKCISTLATKLAALCETAVPDAYNNMVQYYVISGISLVVVCLPYRPHTMLLAHPSVSPFIHLFHLGLFLKIGVQWKN